MSRTLYIVDTSYLCELFKIPGHSNEAASRAVKDRLKLAFDSGSIVFVPIPCIFELGNHIGKIKTGRERRNRANLLYKTVTGSIENSTPWTITPSPTAEFLPDLCHAFKHDFSPQNIGLTDVSVIEEARRIKKKNPHSTTHIWTTDSNLKSYEPDTEPDPFTG